MTIQGLIFSIQKQKISLESRIANHNIQVLVRIKQEVKRNANSRA